MIVVQLCPNTWLQGFKLGMNKIVIHRFMKFWNDSCIFCEWELQINTIVHWKNYLRKVCSAKLLSENVWSGEGLAVEIDKFVCKKDVQCRKANERAMGFWRNLPGNSWVFSVFCEQQKSRHSIVNNCETHSPRIHNHVR